MEVTERSEELTGRASRALTAFTKWLNTYGETSWDHQSFFAGSLGGPAKSLYYRNKGIGTVAVAPMIFCEAFLPSALKEYAWGYPFDWVTRNGTIKAGTPLITTTPYVYEAFLQLYQLEEREEWKEILQSIAQHACNDIKEFRTSDRAGCCSYSPFDDVGGVVNASAYRAFLLTSAAQVFSNDDYAQRAKRNLNFVLDTQQADGSWYYAMDQVRDFVDHYHTCFVMKALAKIRQLTGDEQIRSALEKGVNYYLRNLFDVDGLPKPFSKAPRLTVYKRELYDCAECINLCLLLRGEFPELEQTLHRVVQHILNCWIKSDGSFRSRRLHFGWDNVPMHRWAQSQMFRSLAYYLCEEAGGQTAKARRQRAEDRALMDAS